MNNEAFKDFFEHIANWFGPEGYNGFGAFIDPIVALFQKLIMVISGWFAE